MSAIFTILATLQLLFLVGSVNASTNEKETFDEKLVIWPMPNGFSLLQFEYDFQIPLVNNAAEDLLVVDKFPRQILDLVRKTGKEVKRIEAHLV